MAEESQSKTNLAESPSPQGNSGPEKKPDEKKEDEKPKAPFRWTPLKILFVVVLALVLLTVGVVYFIYSMNHETTDDAYTAGHVHDISARVTGTVVAVLVDDNQFVKEGRVLVQLDPRDYQVKVDEAKANYEKAKADYDRVAALKGDIAISQNDYDQSRSTLDVDKAQLDDAMNQLSYCTITSPADGYVGRKSVEVGNRVTVGGALMSVVQDDWVVANFKETQIGKMKPGQRVKITIDAFSDHPFYGWVDSFSPGSGSAFALLPPDNATGNFTKIVQRVPAKVLFDRESIQGYESRLVPGLSVEAAVDLTSIPKGVRVQQNDQIEKDQQSHVPQQDQPGPP